MTAVNNGNPGHNYVNLIWQIFQVLIKFKLSSYYGTFVLTVELVELFCIYQTFLNVFDVKKVQSNVVDWVFL